MHAGQGPGLSSRKLGQTGGEENVTLTVDQIAAHSHDAAQAGSSSAPDINSPTNAYLGTFGAGQAIYSQAGPGDLQMHADPTSDTGGGQGHDNMSPFQCVNFIIALQGIFPSRN